jgi:hypothetical protein
MIEKEVGWGNEIMEQQSRNRVEQRERERERREQRAEMNSG